MIKYRQLSKESNWNIPNVLSQREIRISFRTETLNLAVLFRLRAKEQSYRNSSCHEQIQLLAKHERNFSKS